MVRLGSRIALAAVIAGGLSLGGCATIESVERAQASADAAGAAAMRAQDTANAAGAAAEAAGADARRAQETAETAGDSASDGLDSIGARVDRLERRVRWLASRQRHGKTRAHKPWYCKPNKWHPKRHC